MAPAERRAVDTKMEDCYAPFEGRRDVARVGGVLPGCGRTRGVVMRGGKLSLGRKGEGSELSMRSAKRMRSRKLQAMQKVKMAMRGSEEDEEDEKAVEGDCR